MIITKLELVGKQKVHVYIDDSFGFWLYKKEIDIYGLKEQETLSDNVYEEIMQNLFRYRCKGRALSLLKQMDRTEKELYDRLLKEYFREDIVTQAILYVKEFKYIDDKRYALSYIQLKQTAKSKRQISNSLHSKGIRKEFIEEAFAEIAQRDEDNIDPEIFAIQRFISKKNKHVDELCKEEKLKLAASLYRKGFSMDNIRRVLLLNQYD